MLSEEGRALSVGGAASSRRPSGIAGAEPFRPAVDSGTTPERKGGTVTAGVTAGLRAALPGVSSKCQGAKGRVPDGLPRREAGSAKMVFGRGGEFRRWDARGMMKKQGKTWRPSRRSRCFPLRCGESEGRGACRGVRNACSCVGGKSVRAGSFVRARRECARRTEPGGGRTPEVSSGS